MIGPCLRAGPVIEVSEKNWQRNKGDTIVEEGPASRWGPPWACWAVATRLNRPIFCPFGINGKVKHSRTLSCVSPRRCGNPTSTVHKRVCRLPQEISRRKAVCWFCGTRWETRRIHRHPPLRAVPRHCLSSVAADYLLGRSPKQIARNENAF